MAAKKKPIFTEGQVVALRFRGKDYATICRNAGLNKAGDYEYITLCGGKQGRFTEWWLRPLTAKEKGRPNSPRSS